LLALHDPSCTHQDVFGVESVYCDVNEGILHGC